MGSSAGSRSQSLRKKCNRIVRSSGSKSMSSSKSLLIDLVDWLVGRMDGGGGGLCVRVFLVVG